MRKVNFLIPSYQLTCSFFLKLKHKTLNLNYIPKNKKFISQTHINHSFKIVMETSKTHAFPKVAERFLSCKEPSKGPSQIYQYSIETNPLFGGIIKTQTTEVKYLSYRKV